MDYMNAFIAPPQRIPFYLRIGIWIAKRVTGKDLLPARLLAWYPKAALGSGVLEALVAPEDGKLNERILKIVRMQASFSAACPFCVDMNSFQYEHFQISQEEIKVLQGRMPIERVSTFSERERLAMEYAKLISQTPLHFPKRLIDDLKQHFSEREIVILASTAAQVNYWARLIQALGVPPAGFSEQCLL
ncbi:MAG: carboxymuconolactone decarboxylase family protein [Anaerolineaceae bacterium]|nr:carboxymuconolactone decarboxylase family protein [Anaerolineaceae bacterium]